MIPGRHYADRSIKGARPYQEDDCGFYPHPPGGDEAEALLLVLADGMGGHRGGAHASKAAVETFIDVFNSRSGSVEERLREAIELANRKVGDDAEGNPELDGMGCTLVGAYIADGEIAWVSVGDSPLWLFRGGELLRLNVDHSMAAVLDEQVSQGKLTAEQAAADPQRHALLAAVTGEPLSMVDGPNRASLQPDDRVVLASDGLLTLSGDEIARTLSSSEAHEASAAVDALIDAVEAREQPRQDNTTVMVVAPASAEAADPATIETGGKRKNRAAGAAERNPVRLRRLALVLVVIAIVVGAGLFILRSMGPQELTGPGQDNQGRADEQGRSVPSLTLERTYVSASAPTGWAQAQSIVLLEDQLYVAGNRSGEGSGDAAVPWLIQLGPDLTLKREWRDLGGAGATRVHAAIPVDDAIVLAGSTETRTGNSQIWLHRVPVVDKTAGAVSAEFGGPDAEEALAAYPGPDGQILVAGRTRTDSNGGWDGLAVLFDRDFSDIWSRTFGGLGNDEFTAVTRSADGFVLVGSTHGEEGNDQDGWLVFIDDQGETDLISVTGQTGSDRLFDLVRVAEAHFVAVGEKGSETGAGVRGWLELVLGDGSVAGEMLLDDPESSRLHAIQMVSDASLVAAGARKRAGRDHGMIATADRELSAEARETLLDRGGVITSLRVDGERLWAAGSVDADQGDGRHLWVGRYAVE